MKKEGQEKIQEEWKKILRPLCFGNPKSSNECRGCPYLVECLRASLERLLGEGVERAIRNLIREGDSKDE